MFVEKEKSIYQVFFSIFNKGILLVEKSKWKHRRKLLSSIFNYDFITSQIPMMIKIADTAF